MADEADQTSQEAPKAPATIPADAIKAILAEYEHDFIGKAHEIVQGLKALVHAAENVVEGAQ